MHHYEDLINIFHDCFAADYNTRLVKGENEPLYSVKNESQPYNIIYFAHGYFSSALHECAHWLIAGKERRAVEDYGYWYNPDGRTAEQQILFQQVEIKPQALEWILAKACNHSFRVSNDNLNGARVDTDNFKKAVFQQVLSYCQAGLSPRAQSFRSALAEFYNQNRVLTTDDFDLQELF